MGEAHERRVNLYRAVLLAAGLVVLGLLFQHVVTLLLAVLITIIIAVPLSAGADRLERYHVPRPLGVLAGLLLGLAVVALVLALVIPPFVEETEEFIDNVPEIVDDVRDRIRELTGATTEDIGDQVQDFLQGFVDEPSRLIGPLASIGLGLAAVLAAIVLILVTAFYMANNPDPLIRGALALFPPDRRDDAHHVMRRLRAAWIGWMQGVLADMLVTGVLLYVGFRIIGLDFAILFAVLSALLVVVPYFGALVGGLLPTLFALTQSPGQALLVVIVYVIVQQIESNVIIPLIMSRTVRLHPAVIAIGVVLVGGVFGLVGLFVAVPILSAAVILAEELWVKPIERAHDERRQADIELPVEAEMSVRAERQEEREREEEGPRAVDVGRRS